MTAPDDLRSARTAAATTSQRTAANPAVSAWAAASAGSGKTRVLTNRVLRLMLEGAPPERILCLTFTKAAAAEMATRLSAVLAEWATVSDDALAGKLQEMTGERPSEDLQGRARRLFAEVIDVPGGMKIQTIHAFCQSLLGRFPLEAGVAPHFSLIEERSASELLQSAREEVFQRIARDGGALAQAMQVIATQVADQDFPKLLGALLKERGRIQDILDRHAGLAGLSLAIDAELGIARGETRSSVLATACGDEACDADGLRRLAAAMLESAKKTDLERGTLLAAWLSSPETRAAGLEAYCKAFFTKAGTGPRLAKAATKEVLERLPEAEEIFAREAARLEALRDRLHAFDIAEATKALFALAQEVFAVYERRKALLGQLDYDDLILKARALLEVSNQAAWVLFKLDGGLDHLLIDEAQDTNPDQWRVVRALSEEFFAGAGAHEARAGEEPVQPRTLFAVGDAKQSIFSFQRADPDSFVAMQSYFSERVQASGNQWRPVDLTVSFRSTETVLRAVDRVFQYEAHQAGLIFGARWEDHVPVRAGQAGLVELWPLAEPLAAPEMEPWAPPTEVQEAASGEQRLAQAIATRIASWLGAESRAAQPEAWLESRNRRIEAGDIMILVQRRKLFVAEMVRALKDRHIPVAGLDRMVLTEQLAVMDLLALGKAVLLPEDDLTLATLLRGPLIGLGEEALFELAHDRGKDTGLWSALQDKAKRDEALAGILETLRGWRDLADFTPPYEFFAAVLNRGGRRALLGRLGPDADDPIEELLNQALAYEAEHAPSLQGFLHWIEAGAQMVKRDLEQAGGAVRVMTVHGAKGLEAPVVFLPDTTFKPQLRDTVFWLDGAAGEPPLPLWLPRVELAEATARQAREAAKAAQEREYRRLLYVAMTRAEDRLYVCGHLGGRSTLAEDCWYKMVETVLADQAAPFAFELSSPHGWSGEGLRLTGAQEAAPEPARETGEAPPPEAGTLPAWIAAAPPPEPTPPRPLAPSRPSEPEPPALSPLSSEKGRAEDSRRFLRGRLIYRLLELLPEVAEERREALAWKLLGPEARGFAKDEQAAMIAETLEVLKHPDFAAIFGPGSRAEAPIAGLIETSSGSRPISGQLDRILVTEEKVLVIDYKSNRPPPRDESGVAAAYLRQMAAYRALLQGIYPGKAIHCALLWTDGPRLMQLSPERLDSHAP